MVSVTLEVLSELTLRPRVSTLLLAIVELEWDF
jgi:hypothetical protein